MLRITIEGIAQMCADEEGVFDKGRPFRFSSYGVPRFASDIETIWKFLTRYNLAELDLGGHALYRSSSKEKLKEFPLNNCLKTLRMSGNRLSEISVVDHQIIVEQTESVLRLGKQRVPVSLPFMQAIQNHAMVSSRTEDGRFILNIRCCEGLFWLLEGVMKCRGLKTLDISNNGFKPSEEALLLLFLNQHPSLEFVKIALLKDFQLLKAKAQPVGQPLSTPTLETTIDKPVVPRMLMAFPTSPPRDIPGRKKTAGALAMEVKQEVQSVEERPWEEGESVCEEDDDGYDSDGFPKNPGQLLIEW